MEHDDSKRGATTVGMRMLLDGMAERRCRERAAEYFGDMLRRIRVTDKFHLADLAEDGVDAGKLTESERQSLVLLDVAVSGLNRETRQPTRLAAEISDAITKQDVLKAAERAILLQKLTGEPTLAGVAGYSISNAYRQLADDNGVSVTITDPPDAGEPELHTDIEAEDVLP